MARPGFASAVLSLAVALLGGCAAPGPTKNPLDTPEDGPPVVSVCYAPLVTDRAGEIEQLARDACAGAGVRDATLRYWKRDVILNDCPLFKKSRIAYFCLPTTAEEDGGMEEPSPPADADEDSGAAELPTPAADDGSENEDGD